MTREVHEFSELPKAGGALPPTPSAAGKARIGVVYNPRSHRNKGRDLDEAARPGVVVAQPKEREDLPQHMADFAARGVEYVIINGGDGTVRDVLTAALPAFGDKLPAFAVLPKGKTNALNVDLGAPSGWSLGEAIDAFESGKRITRRPLEIKPVEGEEHGLIGFILGAGAITVGIDAGQDAHKMGAFDSLAVGATAVWGVVQALFGSDSNVWRRGVPMRILLGDAREELPHAGVGDPARRELLLASTLERFPAGLKPFGPLREGLKLVVFDHPRRRVIVALPYAIFAGHTPAWMKQLGFRQLVGESFVLDIDDKFILDGEAFPKGRYRVAPGPALDFIVP